MSILNQIAYSGVRASQVALASTGQNIANVNTPGYSRRTVDLSATAPDGAGSAGRGVDVVRVRSIRDTMLESRLQHEVPAQTKQATIADSLRIVQATLGTPGSSIDSNLQNFFDSFSRLAEDPVSATARQDVVLQADTLAGAFRNLSASFSTAQTDTDKQIRAAVTDVNSLADQIASLNRSIASGASPESTLHLQDEQSKLVRQLSELIDVSVVQQPNGGMDISIGNGRPLVVGVTSYAVGVNNTPPSGFAALAINGTTVTSEITGGKLGGLLQVRDVTIPGYQGQLDQLAYDVATQVNTLHAAGYDQTGAAAGTLFTPPGAVAGAAAAMAVRPAVAADPRLVAAAGIANGGDNQNAKAIALLREQKVLNGGTASLSDSWGNLVYTVGRDTKVATDDAKNRSDMVAQVDALRDQVSGVSLDEEAAQLLKFQRAYEANAKFFTAVDQMLTTLMNLVGTA